MQTILGRKKRNTKITKLFSILGEAFLYKKGREALFLFLSRIEIATRKWLIAVRSLKGGNSY